MSNSPPIDHHQNNGDVKPSKVSKITLKIQFDTDADPLVLRVKSTTAFRKIYNAVANAKGADLNSFRLNYEGKTLPPNETTPADFNMEDEEVLDYAVEQVGGCNGPRLFEDGYSIFSTITNKSNQSK